ncbi:MAG: glycosyltransferase family 2 protein [Candidatus Calescibacterium sp.]|nr:glycosyltransferase family 2 protein [Candidatus Calescibacterium sp.]MCX7733431.1 glycosyltransferase family 2 protein [bacterium]MDW8087542.1 glycosyltransferase family 2 protein [Candidatus Calescibacterium sp.]
MLLSVVIPAYNEANTIEDMFYKVKNSPYRKEIIIVDNGSTDGTWEIINSFRSDDLNRVKIFRQDKQKGKGAALNTGFKAVEGDIVVIQDADLEYDPENYPVLIKPIESGVADVVYGSRFIGDSRRVFMFSHYLGNRFLSLMANILFDNIITDISTGYKAFSRLVLDEYLPVMRAKGFEFEVEFTARVIQFGFRVYEVPISYYGRTYDEGKKITWKDGIKYLLWMLKCKLDENKYMVEPRLNLAISRRINDIIENRIGKRVLYVGAKDSYIPRFLIGRELLVLSGKDAREVRYLKRKYRETSRLKVMHKDEALHKFKFDTIIIHSDEYGDNMNRVNCRNIIVISDKSIKGMNRIGEVRNFTKKWFVFERTQS